MSQFTAEQLRERSFQRVANALHHFWEEQKHVVPRAASVHTRIFDTLVFDHYIYVGRSKNGGGHREHLVPCVYLRDRAFEMFWEGKDVADVANMIGRLLRVADITQEEARRIDFDLRLKTRMPEGWDPESGSVFARLEAGVIELELD